MRCRRLSKYRRHAKAARVRDGEIVQTVVEPEPSPLLRDQCRCHLRSLTRTNRAHRPSSNERDVADQLVTGIRHGAGENTPLDADRDDDWAIKLVVHIVQAVVVVQEPADRIGIIGCREANLDFVLAVMF